MANAPFPIPAHQTGQADFRHPAFRLASPQGTRRDCSGQALEAQNAEFSMNDIECESAIAAPLLSIGVQILDADPPAQGVNIGV